MRHVVYDDWIEDVPGVPGAVLAVVKLGDGRKLVHPGPPDACYLTDDQARRVLRGARERGIDPDLWEDVSRPLADLEEAWGPWGAWLERNGRWM